MKAFFKTYWKTLLFFALSGLLGGFLTGLYMLDSYPPEIQQQIFDQGLNNTLVGVVTAVQYAGYGVVLGALGIWLGKKIGLWKDARRFTGKGLLSAVAVALIGGVALLLPDLLFFGRYEQGIQDSYATKPALDYVLGMVVLGGVVEEVMLRLFMMSLVAFVLHRVVGRRRDCVSKAVLVTANVISALLFAAGHLPVNALLFGLTPMIVLRCFLLNGGFGLAFGWIYRKYGLRYAMMAHGGCHVVSKLIWIVLL